MADKDNKGNSLELALAQIEKQFGKGAIMRLGEEHIQKVEAVSTGCLTLDIALGIGGITKGRIIAGSYTHLPAHETKGKTGSRLLLEKKKTRG